MEVDDTFEFETKFNKELNVNNIEHIYYFLKIYFHLIILILIKSFLFILYRSCGRSSYICLL